MHYMQKNYGHHNRYMQGNSMDQCQGKSESTHPQKQLKTCQQILTQRLQYYGKNNDIHNQLCCFDHKYYELKLYNKIQPDKLSFHSVVPFGDEDRLRFTHILQGFKVKKAASVEELGLESKQISRGVAAILGMAICDTLGACTEFIPFRKSGLGVIKTGLRDVYTAIENGILQSRHGKIGVWTDDASMGLCMADSIFLNNYLFNPKHIRHMFTLWLYHGLDNGGRKRSIGLGGNISISIDQYLEKQEDYTDPGDGFNNGNGSLMRLAPVPVAYSDDYEKAVNYSGLQSLTTHNGNEAQECCRLMASIIVGLIHRKDEENPKELLQKICNQFQTKNESVRCLARGQQQTPQIYEKLVKANRKFKKFNKSLLDRNWNWKDINHTYSPCRLKQQPGYIGSYCMDALAMALHTVYFSNSFLEVAVTNADMGGDCDTVGSIAGQIAGSMYGLTDEIMNLYSELDDFQSGRYDVFIKAYKLAAKKHIK